MISNHLFVILLLFYFKTVESARAPGPCSITNNVISYTGSECAYLVSPSPTPVTLSITAVGGDGAGGSPSTAPGKGDCITCIYNAPGGTTLYVNVGGMGSKSVGGYNGGGNSGIPINYGSNYCMTTKYDLGFCTSTSAVTNYCVKVNGTSVPGHCSGTSTIQCCLGGNTCSTPFGVGSCIDTSICGGTTVAKYCSGPSNIQCCIQGYGGGGASDVRTVSSTQPPAISLQSRIVIAGGGGGGATNNYTAPTTTSGPGNAGYPNGKDGKSLINGCQGLGGTQTAGGGTHNSSCASGSGSPGYLGIGSDGDEYGGGGGGGFYGGSGGATEFMNSSSGAYFSSAGSGGGGGSSFCITDMMSSCAQAQNGDPTANGKITITILPTPTLKPTGQPTGQPSSQPTNQPSNEPTSQPTENPTSQPTNQPSTQPTSQPISNPSTQPTNQPTRRPSRQPTSQPTRQPTSQSTNSTGKPILAVTSTPKSDATIPLNELILIIVFSSLGGLVIIIFVYALYKLWNKYLQMKERFDKYEKAIEDITVNPSREPGTRLRPSGIP